jgi:hypothetical protein
MTPLLQRMSRRTKVFKIVEDTFTPDEMLQLKPNVEGYTDPRFIDPLGLNSS